MYYENKYMSGSEVNNILCKVSDGVIGGISENRSRWELIEDSISKVIEVEVYPESNFWLIVYMEVTI